MTVDLADYEKGRPLDGDYNEELAALENDRSGRLHIKIVEGIVGLLVRYHGDCELFHYLAPCPNIAACHFASSHFGVIMAMSLSVPLFFLMRSLLAFT